MLKENGWVTVLLSEVSEDAILESASINGEVVPLHTINGRYHLHFSKAGTYSLRCIFHCPVATREGVSELKLPLPRTLSAMLDFTIPDMKADISVNEVAMVPDKNPRGCHLSSPVTTDNGLHIVFSPQGASGETANDTGSITPRVHASTGLLADIRENRIRYEYRVDYQIWHKKSNRFSVALPDSYVVENVEGAGIAEWDIKKSGGNSVVTVQTNFTPVKNYSLTIRFSRKLESMEERLRVPVLKVHNVNRENGCIAIAARKTMEVIIADSLSGLTAVDQSDLHTWMQSRQDLLLRFKYLRTPYGLMLDVKRHQDMAVLVAIADDVEFTTLFTEEGYTLSRFRYHIRNNHKQYLRVTMPGGWQLWSTLVDGEAVMPATSGESEILIPLKKMVTDDSGEQFLLELVYWRKGEKMERAGTCALSLPKIDINAQFINGTLFLPDKYTCNSFSGSLKPSESFSWSTFFRGSNAGASTYAQGNRTGKRFGSAIRQQFSKSGKVRVVSLPVEIPIPSEGKKILFSKKLTIAGEKADFSFTFNKKLPDFSFLFSPLFPVAFFLAGFLCIRNILRNRSRKMIIRKISGTLLSLFLLLILKTVLKNTMPSLFMLVMGMFSGAIVHFAFAEQKKLTGGIPLLLFSILLTAPEIVSAQEYTDSENEEAFAGSSVSLPWNDFRLILDRIKKPIEKSGTAARPPAAYVIGSGEYHGKRLNEKQFIFKVHLTVSVLEKHYWVNIDLGQGAAIYPDIEVKSPFKGTAIAGTDADGNNSVAVRGAGSYSIRYRLVVPVHEQSGISGMRFPVPSQSAASLRLILDKAGYTVTANDIPLTPQTAGHGKSIYEGAIGNGTDVTIRWRQEATRINTRNAMLIGQVGSFYSISPGLIQMNSAVDIGVIHQNIREFTFTLPGSADVINLTGPAVLTWEKTDSIAGNKRQQIRVMFKYDISNRTSFELMAEQPFSDSAAQLQLPDINCEGTSRQEGFIAVSVSSSIELTPGDNSRNVIRKDRRELPKWFEGEDDILYSYQYLSGRYRIMFDMKRHDNISGLPALIEQNDIRSVVREDGKIITEMTMRVKNRGEQFLRIGWHRNRQLWSIYCNNRPARPSFDSAASELLVHIEKAAGKSAGTTVKLVYLEQNRPFAGVGTRTFAFPPVNMPSEKTSLTLFAPSDVDILHTKGNLHSPDLKKNLLRFQCFAEFNLFDLNSLSLDYYKLYGNRGNMIACDFYEKPADTPVERRSGSQTAACTIERRHNPSPPQFTRGSQTRAHVSQKGITGIVSGHIRGKKIKSADIFAKGGMASDIDALGGLSHDAGYGSGYGSGFGGNGAGGIEDLLDQLMSSAGNDAVSQQEIHAFTSNTESGQLSLPINVSIDGTPHTYRSVLLDHHTSPELTVYSRKVFTRKNTLFSLLTILLLITAGSFFTVCCWTGWTLRKCVTGIILPMTVACCLCLITGSVCNFNWSLMVPALFFMWKAVSFAVHKFTSLRAERSLQRKMDMDEEEYFETEEDIRDDESDYEENDDDSSSSV